MRANLEPLIRAAADSPVQFAVPVPHTASTASSGSWSIAGITTFQSGTPYTVQNGFDRNNDGNPNDRPDIGNPDAPLMRTRITCM